MVQPHLDYTRQVWDPHFVKDENTGGLVKVCLWAGISAMLF